jgi:hypothetical protein
VGRAVARDPVHRDDGTTRHARRATDIAGSADVLTLRVPTS